MGKYSENQGVLYPHGRLFSRGLYWRSLLDARPQIGPMAQLQSPFVHHWFSFSHRRLWGGGVEGGGGDQNNRRSKEKSQASWVFAGADPGYFPSCPSLDGERNKA